MKYTILLLLAAALLSGCADFPAALTIQANPSGSITLGATIEPTK